MEAAAAQKAQLSGGAGGIAAIIVAFINGMTPEEARACNLRVACR